MLFAISFMLTCTTNSSICEDPTLCGNQVATNVIVSCTGDLISALQCTNLMFRGFKVSMCPYYALQSECDSTCGHSCKQESDTVSYEFTQGTKNSKFTESVGFWVCRPVPSEDLGNSTCITNLSGSVVTVNCPVRSTCINSFKPLYNVSANVCTIYEFTDLALCNSKCSQPCEYAGNKISIYYTVNVSGELYNEPPEIYNDAFYCRVIDVASNQSNVITIVACCVGGAILIGVVIFVVAWFTCCKTKNYPRNGAKSDNILSGQSKSMQGVDYV
ncbi:Hypothetical_protein [Hexamita inflata]|uniref:Hypothetical_protein n=1 Tax=Hexamita inflata TaxID=28002 RepID=A0AA86QJB9_9EUKA|nr:Hypothetical protein HINF_LOCUS45010 [Hexamita inflata]CAI9957367.1 Hypothetical protein HINF_LOCUS45012 [Hexamita inflata]